MLRIVIVIYAKFVVRSAIIFAIRQSDTPNYATYLRAVCITFA